MSRFQNSIGILGGTFDPPHVGHEFLVRELLDRYQFRELWVIPTGIPYLKKSTLTKPSIRFELAQVAFQGLDPRVKVSEIEITRSLLTNQKTTTWDTLQELKSLGSPLVVCIGSDQWEQIESWSHYPEILKVAQFVVFNRKGHPLSKQRPAEFYETSAPEISSTEIRESIEKTGKIDEKWISLRVKDCLMKHHLYGT